MDVKRYFTKKNWNLKMLAVIGFFFSGAYCLIEHLFKRKDGGRMNDDNV